MYRSVQKFKLTVQASGDRRRGQGGANKPDTAKPAPGKSANDQSILIFAVRTTLPHLSDSARMNVVNSAGVSPMG